VTGDRFDAAQSDSDTSSMLEQGDDEEPHQKDMQDANTGITIQKTLPPSPKTRMIEMMEEERDEQQRALKQIGYCYEETLQNASNYGVS